MSQMTSRPLDRLAEAILREIAGGETFVSLGEKTGVDRRKLSKIADRVDVALTFRELTALNSYFELRGFGIAAAFSPPGVIREIAEHGDVTVVLGSQPDHNQRRIVLSRWDLRTLREVLRAMNATGRTVNLSIEDVIWRDRAAEYFSAQTDVPPNESWHRHLADDGPSVICIGSPKACHAAEVMLARMSGCEPFQREPANQPPPFFFAWGNHDRIAEKLASSFKRTSRQFRDSDGATDTLLAELTDSRCRTCAFFDGELWPVFRHSSPWQTYGVVAAQRRPGNQVWLVLAGLTGPATLGAALAVREFVADLPAENDSGCSKLVWATVTSQIEEHDAEGFRLDGRHVIGRPVLSPLRQWPE